MNDVERAVLEAADVWMSCRERCNDPDLLISYADATDNLSKAVTNWRENA